jgi:hypothetical protein
MKNAQDKTCQDVEFTVGDWFWLCLLYRRIVGVTVSSDSKLGPKFYGLFQVVQRIGLVSYKLELCPKAQIHGVFHVSLLKKFEGPPPSTMKTLPAIHHGWVLPTLEKIVKAKLNRGVGEVLVQWMGRSVADASLEELEKFKIRYTEV